MRQLRTAHQDLVNTTFRSWRPASVCAPAATTESKQGIYLPLSREKGAPGG